MDASDGLADLERRLQDRRERTAAPPSRHGRPPAPAGRRSPTPVEPVAPPAPNGSGQSPRTPANGTAPARRTGGGRRRSAGEGVARRLSVDLEKDLHRVLRNFALDHEADGTEVVRILIELLADPHVGQLVAERIALQERW